MGSTSGYIADWKPTKPEYKCSKCDSDNVWYRNWEDWECHEDIHYHCHDCGHAWWYEGIDS